MKKPKIRPYSLSKLSVNRLLRWIKNTINKDNDISITEQLKILSELRKRGKDMEKVRLDDYESMVKAKAKADIRKARLVAPFPMERITPKIQKMVRKSVFNSTELIKLNRQQTTAEVLRSVQSFFATPKEQRKIKSITTPLIKLGYKERRVYIDQSSKFSQNVQTEIQKEQGAIGWFWITEMDGRERQEHAKLNGTFYLYSDSWADKKGLVKITKENNSDEHEQPSDAVMCRCRKKPVYTLKKVPIEYLTLKGKELLK